MAASRESILQALYNLLSKSASFKSGGRRLVDPEGITPDESPALFLVAHEDPYKREQGYNLPPKREISALAFFFNTVGKDPNTGLPDPNAIPEKPINDALDALDALLAPDNRMTKANTLGGLVQACLIDGTVMRSSGDVNGRAAARIPIRILLP
jgi:hypothetical protein